jgi:serine/threonine protein kinase
VVAYELMTGVMPFDDSSEAEIIRQIRHEAHRAPSLNNAGLDHEFDAIIDRALAKSPTDRFSSVEVFSNRLLEWARGNDLLIESQPLSEFAAELFAKERRESRMQLDTVEFSARTSSSSEYTRIAGTGYALSTSSDDAQESIDE